MMEKSQPKRHETVLQIKGEYLVFPPPRFGPVPHPYKIKEYKILDPSMLKCRGKF